MSEFGNRLEKLEKRVKPIRKVFVRWIDSGKETWSNSTGAIKKPKIINSTDFVLTFEKLEK